MSSKFISQIKEFGINPSKVHRNLSVEKLVEVATQKNEGMITSTGSLSVKTGKYTGRSPDDRFIIFDDLTHDKIHWGKVNKQLPTETFDKFIRMNASDSVPSTSGIASKSLRHITVSPGSCDSNSAAEGLMKSW